MNSTEYPFMKNPYRTHTCGELTDKHVGQSVNLAGWVFRRRDHGGVAFIDLRDHYGLTQVVFHPDVAGSTQLDQAMRLCLESVIQVKGKVVARAEGQVNSKLDTGAIEIDVQKLTVLSEVKELPYALADDSIPEDLRLQYRFLDLRRDDVHSTILLRSHVVKNIRERMWGLGFTEFQTPILTASSPEGARDYLVPSRLHPGKFYALPQAPQQFKQLLMVSGFDRYFQIAPCFRDEDARADRSPTDFYQLDMEMSFPTQDAIFAIAEDVVGGVFDMFKNWNGNNRNPNGRALTPAPWVRIAYDDALLKYASDKPDLRCPIIIHDVSHVWEKSDFAVFKNIITGGGVVRAMGVKGAASQPRSWFDDIGSWAQSELGAPAAPGYLTWKDGEVKGPLAKFLSPEQLGEIAKICGVSEGDCVFFAAGKVPSLYKILNPLRVRLGRDCGLNAKDIFHFCWIVDFPMFERDEATGKVDFSHNPFSMPQGGLEALEKQDPLTIKAYQYDLVCNGYELCSGAIRNHLPQVMLKAFEIAGYGADEVKNRFSGLWNAFHYGAPPHGGMAPGIDRIVMLLAESNMVREVIAFPMTQRGEDLLMNAPNTPRPEQLKELHIQVKQK